MSLLVIIVSLSVSERMFRTESALLNITLYNHTRVINLIYL